jgi:hypothetical protein
MESIAWWRWAVLLVLFAGLFGVWFWARHKAGGPLLFGGLAKGPPRVRLVERRYVDARTWVALVEADGRSFLLAQGPAGGAWQPLGEAKAATEEKKL